MSFTTVKCSKSIGQSMSSLIFVAFLLLKTTSFGHGQQQQVAGRSNIGGTTLVVSENPNGAGISVVDRATNRQILDTNNLEVNSDEVNSNSVQENQVVAGLLEWLKKKKREKEQQKQPIILPVPQPQPYPIPLPQPLPYKHERKQIHIHINNHIKKDHKKHHHHKKHHGGYEDYHDGHYHDLHDKFYMGKFHAPLLSHHYSFDHFDLGGGGHYDDHYGDSHGDYHAGYESRPEPQFASSSTGETMKATTKRPSARADGQKVVD